MEEHEMEKKLNMEEHEMQKSRNHVSSKSGKLRSWALSSVQTNDAGQLLGN
jgi:hypothetical protein